MSFLIQSPLEYYADATPSHPAISCNGIDISYAELNQSANKLANALFECGAHQKANVGIFHHKALSLGTAIYGILKSGCVFVPLDPFMPPERLEFIIKDCDIKYLISSDTQAKILRKIDSDLNLQVFGVEADIPFKQLSWNQIEKFPASAPELNIIDDDLGYIMYTSGSTGQPKGMMHTHLGSKTYARWGAAHLKLKADDRVASHAPLHFDLSIFDFFSTAHVGATVVLVPEPITRLPASWTNYIEKERISVVFTVPYTLISMMEHGAMDSRDLTSLRWILYGGEPYPPKQLATLMKKLPQTRFSNVYGPAEAPCCTIYDLSGPPETNDPIPIGTVSRNSEDIIVDERNNDCEDGVAGELCIRSTTLTRGYWKRKDLNEKAYLVRERDGVYPKMYFRTGDRVIRDQHGLLHFLGRADRMIKTRGHRVELDELEATMAMHDLVLEAAAYTVDDNHGSKEIHSTVLIKQGVELTSSELLRFVKSKLPAYAIPVKLTVSDTLPRTSTGKIDRRKLSVF